MYVVYKLRCSHTTQVHYSLIFLNNLHNNKYKFCIPKKTTLYNTYNVLTMQCAMRSVYCTVYSLYGLYSHTYSQLDYPFKYPLMRLMILIVSINKRNIF